MAHSTFLSIALILPILAADIPGSFVIKKIEGLQTFSARWFRSARNAGRARQTRSLRRCRYCKSKLANILLY
jgi:hypothetical protein